MLMVATTAGLANAERNLGIQWVIATVVGWALGFYVCETFVSGLTFSTSVTEGAVIGIFLGLTQGWVLRNQTGRMWWWLLATIVGFAVGKALGQSVSDGISGLSGYLVTGAIIGFVAGLLQWITLRSRVPGAAWWLLASTLGWAAGWSFVAFADQSPDLSTVAVYVVGGIGATVAGLVTAAALILRLRGRSATSAATG
jgi:hypothetical protein